MTGADWQAAFINSSNRLVEVSGELRTMRAWPWWRRLLFLVAPRIGGGL